MNDDNELAPRSNRLAKYSGLLCLVLAISIAACHWFQSDELAALTLIPAWLWLVPGLLLLLIARRTNMMLRLACIVAWVSFLAFFVEETRSLIRIRDQPQTRIKDHKLIRVATLNCSMGNLKAVEELIVYEPDVVLLQESPGEDRVRQLAVKLFGEQGSYAWGGDTSVLMRWPVEPIHVDRKSKFTHVKTKTEREIEIDVVSLRLSPPVFRADFWTGEFWNDHRLVRVKHREELELIAEHIDANFSKNSLCIVGGDFNLPANDGALKSLPPQLTDTFYNSGSGWGNTATSDWPLFRVDQIWSNTPVSGVSKAYQCVHSDHRFVVVDLPVGDLFSSGK